MLAVMGEAIRTPVGNDVEDTDVHGAWSSCGLATALIWPEMQKGSGLARQ
ncbi:hypothetical protein SAMN05518801_13115 [Novosphingobium sp. CF614]|nr:hypothetical protein [Novosphingobium sp. CF614]SFG47065.1 hypothetical protein SAMN05518801_13115 [Novosphingobium sp. CF614]